MAIQILPPGTGDEKMLLDPFPTALISSVEAIHATKRRTTTSKTATNGHTTTTITTKPTTNGVPKTVTAPPAKTDAPTKHVNPHWGRFSRGTWLNTIGCALVILLCPVLVIVAEISLSHFDGSLPACLWALLTTSPLSFAQQFAPRPSAPVTAAYFGWIAFQVLLYAFLPAKQCFGQRTPAGHQLPYHVNGLAAWGVSHAVAAGAVWMGWLDPAIVAKNWRALVVAFNVYGYVLPAVAYVKAHVAPTHNDDRKFSGSWIYDYYMGIELNPRIGRWFDFKLFHNGRPGIVAWTLM